MTPPENNDAIDWRAMLAMHDRWLRTVVYSRLKEPHAVDDVMQEIALSLIEKSPSNVAPGKVAPYLYRMAVRQSLMTRRKWGRRRKIIDRYAESYASPTETAYDPLELLLADERRTLIRRVLDSLNHRDAEILLMKYTMQSSYREIASLLGVSESAVETRLHRARKRMRAALTAAEVIENVGG